MCNLFFLIKCSFSTHSKLLECLSSGFSNTLIFINEIGFKVIFKICVGQSDFFLNLKWMKIILVIKWNGYLCIEFYIVIINK